MVSSCRFAIGPPGTATVIGPVSANSVYGRSVIGVYVGAGLTNGYITKIP